MSIYPEGRGPLDYMRRLARGLLPAFQCPEISPRHHSGPLVLLPSSALLGSSETRQDTLSLSPHIRLGVQDAREVSINPGSRIHPASKGQWGGRRRGGAYLVGRLPSAVCRLLPAVGLMNPEKLDTPVPVVRVLVRAVPTFPFRPRSANTESHTQTHINVHTLGSHCAPSKPDILVLVTHANSCVVPFVYDISCC